MANKSIISTKTFNFALKIIDLYRLLKQKQEFDIARQILRSGTSIGANVEEAIGAQSRKDFLSKISIAYKESRETNYWLRIIKAKEIANVSNLLLDSVELIKILTAIQKTTKKNN